MVAARGDSAAGHARHTARVCPVHDLPSEDTGSHSQDPDRAQWVRRAAKCTQPWNPQADPGPRAVLGQDVGERQRGVLQRWSHLLPDRDLLPRSHRDP